MAFARAGGLITQSGNENSLLNLHVQALPFGQGALRDIYGSDPVRRFALLSQARVLVTGSWSWNPVLDTLLGSGDSPNGTGSVPATDYAAPGAGGVLEVRKGGALTIGTEDLSGADGPFRSVGLVSLAKKGANASDVASAAILGLPGSSITLLGVTLIISAAFRLDGARTTGDAATEQGAACVFRARGVTLRCEPGGAIGYFAPRLFTSDYQIDTWHQIGGVLQIQARSATSYIRNITLEKMNAGIGVTGNSFGTATDGLVIEGITGINNVLDGNMFNGYAAIFYNSPQGTNLKVDLQSRAHPGRSYGRAEYRQRVRIIVKGTNGVPIIGARVHYEDFVQGRGHENWSAKNVGLNQAGSPSAAVNYVDQRTQSVLSAAGGNADLDVLMGNIAYNVRPASGQTLPQKTWALRGQTNVRGEDIMPVHVHSYRHLAALIPVICQDAGRLDQEAALVLDPNITELIEATVAAYTGIAIAHPTLALPNRKKITVTTDNDLSRIYDYAKYDKLLAGSEVHPTRAGMLANADGTILDLGDYDVEVAQGGLLRASDKFKSIRTTGTITTTGNGHLDIGYQDSTGKSILLRLGAPHTAVVYRTAHDGPKTWLAPDLAAVHRITVPPASTVELCIKRIGTFYKKFSVAAANIAELTADLVRNPAINTAAIIDNINVLHWRDDPHGVYGGNIYFEQNAPPLTHILRLGNVTTTGSPELTRALTDRRMTTRTAMEATLDHDDVGRGPAYEIRVDRVLRDEAWLDWNRQPVTTPPNPEQGDGTGPGTLQKMATYGLYVVNRDGITPYIPSLVGDYFVYIDPPGVYPALPADDVRNLVQSLITDPDVLQAIAARVQDELNPRLQALDTDITGVGRQLAALPIDELLHVYTDRHTVPLAGAHVFTGEGAYSMVAGDWQFDYEGPTADSDPVSTLNAEGFVAFDLAAPATDPYVLEITVRAQALTGPARDIDPGVQSEWVCGAGTVRDVRRTLGFIIPSHPVRVHAAVGELGPPVTIRYNIGHPADSINLTDFAVDLNPRVHGADDHLRIVVSSIKWTSAHAATLQDFRADLTVLEQRLTAARAALLDHLNADITTRLAAVDYTAPGPAVDLTDLQDDVTTLLQRVTAAKMAFLDANISSRLPASAYVGAADLTDLEADVTTLLQNVAALTQRISVLPRYLAGIAHQGGVLLTAQEAAKALHGSGSSAAMTTAPQGGSRTVAVYDLQDITAIAAPARLLLSRAAESTQVAHGDGDWQLYFATDVDGFPTENDYVNFETANNPAVQDNYGGPGEPASLPARDLDLAVPAGANRIIISYYRTDAAQNLNAPTTIRISGLRYTCIATRFSAGLLHDLDLTNLDVPVSTRAAPADIPTATFEIIKQAIVPLTQRLSQQVIDRITADARLARQILTNKYDWTANQLIIYEDDGLTVLETFNLSGDDTVGGRTPA